MASYLGGCQDVAMLVKDPWMGLPAQGCHEHSGKQDGGFSLLALGQLRVEFLSLKCTVNSQALSVCRLILASWGEAWSKCLTSSEIADAASGAV